MSLLDVVRPAPSSPPVLLEHLSWSALHSALEHYYREHLVGSQPGLDELLAAYQQVWRQDRREVRFGLREDHASLEQLARRMLRAFLASEHARPSGTVLGVEEELQGPLVATCPEILARVDLVTLEDSAVVVTDFKTSGSRWSDAQLEQNGEQLLLYSELARRLLPGRELRLRFLVLTKTKEPAIERHEVAVDPARVTRLRSVLQRVWQSMEAGIVYPAPSPLQCPGCPYRRACRAWPGAAL